jgi:hypothetical protein
MYTITGSVPSASGGRTIRTRTSPTSAGTVIQRSSTGSLSIGAAWTSSSTLRASAGVSSYRNGGVDVASTNACDSGSSTTGGCVVMDMCLFAPLVRCGGVTPSQAATGVAAASRISWAVASGCETVIPCDAPGISVVRRAPARLAM